MLAKAFLETGGGPAQLCGHERSPSFRKCYLYMTYNETAQMAIPRRDKRSPTPEAGLRLPLREKSSRFLGSYIHFGTAEG